MHKPSYRSGPPRLLPSLRRQQKRWPCGMAWS
jgi:hypothetical protein